MPLTEADLTSLGDEASRSTGNLAAAPTTRVIVGNLTEGQALQINGQVGQENWYAVSNLEIRNNKATGKATQINGLMSTDAFSQLLQHRAATVGK